MKKRTITVEVLDTPFLPGDEYIANRYPHDGVFQLVDGLIFVKYGPTVTVVCFPAGFNPFTAEMVSEVEPQVAQAARGIDNLTFLKALAISKNPDLALDLCK